MKIRWLKAWIIQIVTMLFISLLQALSYWLNPTLYDILLWVGMPLAGMYSAYRAVLGGLLNYAAWVAPPICLLTAHLLVWGYSPSAAPALLCAFISLIGAAAGEVMVQRKQKTKRH